MQPKVNKSICSLHVGENDGACRKPKVQAEPSEAQLYSPGWLHGPIFLRGFQRKKYTPDLGSSWPCGDRSLPLGFNSIHSQGSRELEGQSHRVSFGIMPGLPQSGASRGPQNFGTNLGPQSGLWALSRARTPQRGAKHLPRMA